MKQTALHISAAAIVIASGLVFARAVTAAESYQYDPMGRLTDVSYANGGSLHYTYDANGNILSVVTSLATGVEGSPAAPQFTLGPPMPNPGAGERRLSFTLPSRGHVSLRVFDVTGRLAATLLDRDLDAGRHDMRFGTDAWANGVYYYRLTWSGQTKSGRLVVLR